MLKKDDADDDYDDDNDENYGMELMVYNRGHTHVLDEGWWRHSHYPSRLLHTGDARNSDAANFDH